MFMLASNPNREMQIILKGVKRKLGEVPPHWELFATISPTRFKMFLDEINYLTTHPNINPDFFAFIRFYIAAQNGFGYCEKFNEALLLSRGYTSEALHSLKTTKKLPLDEEYQALFNATMSAVEAPENFSVETIEELKNIGWSDADIYDAVDHGAFLFKFSKILRAYSKA